MKYLISSQDTNTNEPFYGDQKVIRDLDEAKRFADEMAARASAFGNEHVVVNIHPLSFWNGQQRSIKTVFSDKSLTCIDFYGVAS